MSEYRYFLPDETLLAIGRITVNFAIVELVIAAYVEALLTPRDSDAGRAVTAGMSFKRLLDLLDSLHRLRVKDPDEHERLDSLIKRCLILEERRNVITHSHWSPPGEELGKVTRWKTTARRKTGLRDDFQKMTDAELHGLADELTKMHADITHYMVESKWIQDNAMITIDVSDPPLT